MPDTKKDNLKRESADAPAIAPVGRPPMYTSAKDMEKKIKAYFKACNGKLLKDADGNIRTNKNGVIYLIHPFPPTVTGLALALGFTSRQALLNYQAKEEFVDTITRAKSKIEEYAETRLYDKDGVNGAKFALANNFKGWKDKGLIEITEPVRVELSEEVQEWAQ